MEIKRDRYLKKLIDKRHNGMIKVITGIRRCGKTYLLFKIFYEYLISIGVNKNNIIFIPLDDLDYVEYRNPIVLNQYIKSKLVSDDQYYIFIDEAQYAISKEESKDPSIPLRLYGVLNSLLRKSNVDVYIIGSNSKFLSTDVMTEFRGRGDEIHIAPLAFSEYFPATGKNKEEAWRDYLYYGGLPHILAESSSEDKCNYLNKLCKEIYLRDLCERYELRDQNGLELLMKVIASEVSSLTNAQKILNIFKSAGSKGIGISMPTISNYLIDLQEGLIIQKTDRFNIKEKKSLSTPSKYYYSDLGLRNAVLNFSQYDEAKLMENAIYNELVYRDFNIDVGVVETRIDNQGKKTRKQLEVDFVANQSNKRYYIQCVSAHSDMVKIEQDQAALIKIPDSFKKLIVVGSNQPIWRNDKGITHIGIFDFLLNEHSLDL